jgi:hypothetical protein
MGLRKNIPGKQSGHSAYTARYQNSFRENVFTLLKLGYDKLDKAPFINEEEPAITGELAKSMKSITHQSGHPQWVYTLAVHDDPPLNTTQKYGKSRPRADLIIEQTGEPTRPEFTFEAKRFYKRSGIKEYLGKEGLGMFICGIYAPDRNELGMLGYVQIKDTDHWKRELFKAMEQSSPQPEELTKDLIGFSSQHQRDNGSTFSAYHALLLFQQ